MKRLLSLELVAIVTVGIFVSVPKPALAYCVYNETSYKLIHGKDTRRFPKFNLLDRYWEKYIEKGERDCCPGKNRECQDATLVINGGLNGACEVKVDAHGWVVVREGNAGSIFCDINGRL